MSVVDMPKTADSQVGQDPAEAKGGGKKKLVIVLLVVALVGGAGYWFFLKPTGPKKAPEPGVVIKLDAIQVNLADDHYLKVGIALQASKSAGEEVDGSKALDQTIALFSGRTMDDLARSTYRERMKKQLETRLEDAYEGDVIGVYFTDFVTQ
jgi:flagellar protein FliL